MGLVERTQRWSLRRRVGLLGLAGLLLIGLLATWLAVTYRDAADAAQRSAGLQPLADSARDLNVRFVDADGWIAAAVIDGLLGRPEAAAANLQDYRIAIGRAQTSLRDLAVGSRGYPELGTRVRTTAEALDKWVTVDPEPTRGLLLAGDAVAAAATTTSEAADAAYDAAIEAIRSLQADIDVRRAVAEQRFTDFGAALRLALILTFALMLAFLGFAYLLLRRWVLRPLADLGEQMEAVALDGDYERPIREVGPSEIVALSHRADTMRDRLVEQIKLTKEANQALTAEQPTIAELRAALEPTTGPTPGVVIAGGVISRAGDGLAGDVFESMLLDDGRVALLVADVSGHGQKAGLLALRMKLIARRVMTSGEGPAAALAELQQVFAGESARFATCVIVEIDPVDGRLVWANAGHHPPVLLRDDDGDGRPDPGESIERLAATGPLLMPHLSGFDTSWVEGVLPMGADDVLLIWSDGLIEGRDDDGREIGEEGVLRLVDDARRGRGAIDVRHDPAELVRVIVREVRHRLGGEALDRDDVTLVVATRAPLEIVTGR